MPNDYDVGASAPKRWARESGEDIVSSAWEHAAPIKLERSKMTTTRYRVGSVHETPKGLVEILEYRPGYRENGKKIHPRATIKFLKTGSVLNLMTPAIASGHFSDPREPSVYGVGYIGSDIKIPSRGEYVRRVYDLWANMLRRCYGEYAGQYKNCIVDKRWHSFTNFLNTIVEVEGYDAWERKENVHLDKDFSGKRIYSRDTCKFIPAEENVKEGFSRRWHRE